jgi:hypothetical protein
MQRSLDKGTYVYASNRMKTRVCLLYRVDLRMHRFLRLESKGLIEEMYD